MIDSGVRETPDICEELLEKRCEEGWTSKTDLWERLSVCRYDVLDSNDVWACWISIQREAVINGIYAHVSRNTSKSKDREALIRVIWLDDSADVHQGTLVLVVGSEVMERAWVRWVSIGCSVVDCRDD